MKNNYMREFNMYALKKEIKKLNYGIPDKLLTYLFQRKKVYILLIGEIQLEIKPELNKLIEIRKIEHFELIKTLEIPNNTFVWILDKNTVVHSKEFLNSLLKANTKYDFLYFDEEFNFKKDIYPFLKPCWSPIYFSYNSIGNAFWINSNVLKDLKYETLDLLKRNISMISNKVFYISETISQSEVDSIEIDNNFKSDDMVKNQNDLVSIIILTKDKADYLTRLLESIEKNTIYNNYEIIIVDHDSKEDSTLKLLQSYSDNPKFKVLKYKGEFNFSKMNNFAVEESNGSYLVFLNNDIEIIENNWIERMLFYSKKENIGVVGTKLIYPDNKLQHGGISVGIYSTSGHFQRGIIKNDPGYMNTCKYPREVLAVTGACMMIEKNKFVILGMFDENFKVIFNDVDLCLKSYENKLTNLVIENLIFIHHEGVTRGLNNFTKNKDKDVIKLFWNKWGKYVRNDPYFNRHFSRFKEELEISF